LGFSKYTAHPSKISNKERSPNVLIQIKSLIGQALLAREKKHEGKKEKKRIRKKFTKRRSFSQVEMTFGLMLAL